MSAIAEAPSIEITDYPEREGMQGDLYAFHHMALEQWLGAVTEEKKAALQQKLVHYPDHDQLMAGLTSGEIDFAIIAVDNNNSGRVTTAIEALRNNPAASILGKIAIGVKQHALLWPEHEEKDIIQGISQRPALIQSRKGTDERGWVAAERADTAASAKEVAASHGMIENAEGIKVPTAAIGPRLAGEKAGLKVGNVLSPPGNATTFWVITTNPEKYAHLQTEAATHAAFTFSVPDTEGGLLDAVSRFSDADFDFTDIDCHLAPKDSSVEGRRSFFAEVSLDNVATLALFKELVNRRGADYEIDVLGIYADRTDPSIHTTAIHHDNKPENIHELWSGRDGHEHEDGSPVLYVQGTNRHKMLQTVLRIIKESGTNVDDMSRPLMPPSNGSRGFFFNFTVGTETTRMGDGLVAEGYTIELYTYRAKSDSLIVA